VDFKTTAIRHPSASKSRQNSRGSPVRRHAERPGVTGSVTVFGQPEQVGGVSAAWLEAYYFSSGEALRDGIRARRQAAEAWCRR
jgi:hypothetical protein